MFSNIDAFRERYDFDVSTPIGKGGFAEVYRARDCSTGEWVAVKKSEVSTRIGKYSLQREFETAKALSHPNLLKHHDCFRFETTVGLFDFGIMEYADRGDLDDFIATFPGPEEINNVLKGILSGLSYLHEQNIIHRDLKPANILIREENGVPTPKIIDFGISKMAKRDRTVLSNIIGSYEYMSPEQLGGDDNKISTNSDLWSFGVIVYQIFTGELPFGARAEGHSATHIMKRVLDASLPANVSAIPEPYQSIARLCLQKDPNARVKNAGVLAGLLERKEPEAARPVREPAVRGIRAGNGLSLPQPEKLAYFGRRLSALLLDGLVAVLGMFAMVFLLSIFTDGNASEETAIGVGLLPAIAYLLFRDTVRSGQSVGRILTRQVLWDLEKDRPCSLNKSLIRNLILLAFIYTVIPLLAEGLVVVFHKEHRGLLCLITGTGVRNETP